MKDRTREAVFNLIGPEIRGKHVFDLFAGTGAMAFESLSRGARSATMIERHMGTVRVIQQNVAALKLEGRADVIQSNVFFWGRCFCTQGDLPTVPIVEVVDTEAAARRAALIHASVIYSVPKHSAAARPSAGEFPWTVICCPPYAFYEERFDELARLLRMMRDVAPPDSMFVVEAETPFDFQRLWESDWRTRDYAPAAIGIDTV